ncbi:MAG: DUF928 domain-containing protein [bacterium]|nr:DUF928 domain-containing protein [bacterium]
MTNRRRSFFTDATARGVSTIALAVLFLASVALAESPPRAKKDEAKAEKAAEAAEAAGREAAAAGEANAAALIRFVPPNRGKARRSAAGGTRGVDTSAVSSIRVAVVAPAEGLTTRAQPVLYWYLSRETDARIDVVLIDDDAIDPLLEFTLPTPVEAGIHGLDLSDHGIELERGRVYRWSVAVVRDAKRRSNDIMTEGVIERVAASDELERSLEAEPGAFAPYALSGIWYDALAALRSARDASPADGELHSQEVALLEQIELPEVARYMESETR